MRILALLLLFTPQILGAETPVTIRSGEHDEFTRFVLSVGALNEWQILESRGEIKVVFTAQDLSFDFDDVFERIPRTRVTALSAETGSSESVLIFEISCACAVNSFIFNEGYLVIDIQDGGPLPEVHAAQAPPPAEYAYWQPEMLGSPPDVGHPVGYQGPPELPMDANMETADSSAIGAESMMNVATTRAEGSTDPEMLARIEEAQNQLLLQLTRAADQGLIDFVPAVTEPPAITVVEEMEQVPAEEQVLPDPELLRQLNARTAYDDAAETGLAEIVNEFAMPQCIENAEFQIVDDNTGAAFSDQVASFRAGIYGEFDILNVENVFGLAKLYIANGLGAEARAILAELGDESQNRAILMDVASIIDGGEWVQAGSVSKGENCGGSHEMWFLIGGSGRPVIVETEPVIAAFSEYPIGVRLLIGPRLADAYLDAGEFDAAHLVLEIVRRAAAPETVPMKLASANLLESTDKLAEANDLFETVAVSREIESTDAIFALAREALTHEPGIPEAMLTDLSGIAFTQRDTAIGDEARLWEIRVSARINGLNNGLRMIENDLDQGRGMTAELPDIAAEIMLYETAERQGALQYAEAIVTYVHLLPDDISADNARVHVAQEMTALGLPDVALTILEPALRRENQSAKLMAANAHLVRFDPDAAMEMVSDNPSIEAVKIMLSALLQKGDHDAISKILNDPANAGLVDNDLAWRAGDWQNIQGNDQDATMAAFMQGESHALEEFSQAETSDDFAFLTDMQIAEEPNLATAKTLLDINRASREFIEDTLAEGSALE